jgi:2-phospho-L-lactate guanylyltransferase
MVDSSKSFARSTSAIAVVIPIKAFEQAKDRLSSVLNADQRKHLARTTALGVIESTRPAALFVVCDNPEVAQWATSHGATVVHQLQPGLNSAVQAGIAAAQSFDRVMIVHGDLPLPHRLRDLLDSTVAINTVTIVPDRHRDGTNVLIIPPGAGFMCHYGAKSFEAHIAEATRLGLPIEMVSDDELALDIDTPDDLNALPTQWLEQHNITLF